MDSSFNQNMRIVVGNVLKTCSKGQSQPPVIVYAYRLEQTSDLDYPSIASWYLEFNYSITIGGKHPM